MKVFGLACIFLGVLFFGIAASYAQPPDILWSRSFGRGECHSIQQTSDEGYILEGDNKGILPGVTEKKAQITFYK